MQGRMVGEYKAGIRGDSYIYSYIHRMMRDGVFRPLLEPYLNLGTCHFDQRSLMPSWHAVSTRILFPIKDDFLPPKARLVVWLKASFQIQRLEDESRPQGSMDFQRESGF